MPTTSASELPLKGPTLVTAPWCPFTTTAEQFWSSAVEEVGQTLQVVHAEEPQGEQVIRQTGAAGVPCLITPDTRLHYGLNLSPDEATRFLTQNCS